MKIHADFGLLTSGFPFQKVSRNRLPFSRGIGGLLKLCTKTTVCLWNEAQNAVNAGEGVLGSMGDVQHLC
jgi:hypothetical protein